MKAERTLLRTFHEALRFAHLKLSENSEIVSRGSVDSEAEQLVSAAFRVKSGQNLKRFDLLMKGGDEYPAEAAEILIQWCQLRVQGHPLQYLTGYQFFLNHEYRIRREVLIPRPETEVLVVSAMEVLRNEYREGFLGIEIGIGSGVISVELLAEFPKLTMIASEFSQIAQSCARENAARILGGDAKIEHRLKLLTPKNSLEVFEPFSSSLAQERSDFLITNPPYLVATSDEEVDLEVKDHEPHLALFSPPQDSVYFYRKLAEGAVHFLKPSGYLFAELPHERSNVIVDLFNEYNWETEIRLDLTGRERVLIARLRS